MWTRFMYPHGHVYNPRNTFKGLFYGYLILRVRYRCISYMLYLSQKADAYKFSLPDFFLQVLPRLLYPPVTPLAEIVSLTA